MGGGSSQEFDLFENTSATPAAGLPGYRYRVPFTREEEEEEEVPMAVAVAVAVKVQISE